MINDPRGQWCADEGLRTHVGFKSSRSHNSVAIWPHCRVFLASRERLCPAVLRVHIRKGRPLTIEAEENRRVFDRIAVEGVATIDEESCRIRDISVGGFSAFGRYPDLSEGDIKSIKFRIKHGDLEVSGKANFECLSNGFHGPLRFKMLNASESVTEFFRAATLRSTSGADYAASWMPEEVQSLARTKKSKHMRGPGVLPSVLATAIFLALMLFIGQSSSAQAVWITYRHALEAPVTGTLQRDFQTTIDVKPNQKIASFAAQTFGGTKFEMPLMAGVRANSVDWLYNSGDLVQQGDIVAYATIFPLERGAQQVAVSINIPLVNPGIGDTVILRTSTGQIVEAKIERFSTHADALTSGAERFHQYNPENVFIARISNGQTPDYSGLRVEKFRTAARLVFARWVGR